MKTYIKGTYRKSIFESEKGYIIGLFKVLETNDLDLENFIDKTITFTGYFHELTLDDTYLFYGEQAMHPKYGYQFQVAEYERVKPEDKDGIVSFLSSDLFKGVGEKLAKKIVNTLGEKALNLILEDKDNLRKVPKISMKKVELIYQTLLMYEKSHQIIVALTEMGFTMIESLAVYHVYKHHTLSNIEHNIYNIIDEAEIRFSRVDAIAKKNGITIDDERRIEACLMALVRDVSFEQGDTYLWFEEIMKKSASYLGFSCSEEVISNAIRQLVMEQKMKEEDNRYYSISLYEAEHTIECSLARRLKHSHPTTLIDPKTLLTLEECLQITYNKRQKEAILNALNHQISIITGGPGTGKTTIIKAICELYKNSYKGETKIIDEIALLAPTGRASKRMSQATLYPAMTIHRFLKWNKETGKFAVNEQHKNSHSLIIVDEVSMIDTELFAALLKGISDTSKLVLVGDANQLPSVGSGQILKDLIDSDQIEVVALTELYRQAAGSAINVLARDIQDDIISEEHLLSKEDYTFLKASANQIIPTLQSLCETLLKKGYDHYSFQILAPMYAGLNGIDHLNEVLQPVLNPSDHDKRELVIGNTIYREQDKILQLVNMPDENVFNGDIGTIKYILYASTSSSKKDEIYVDYDGVVVKYLPKDLYKIKHGFVISIHKSQGSEFDAIIMPIEHSYKRMLYKNLIYTGITRAKKKLILLGEESAFLQSVQNNREDVRKTTLKQKLENIAV